MDHWYASEHLWRLAGHDPGAGFAETFLHYAPSYRAQLSRVSQLCDQISGTVTGTRGSAPQDYAHQ